MAVSRQLHQLQEIDLQLEANEQAVSQITSQLENNQVVVSAQTRLKLELQRLEELQRRQHDTEWEVTDLTNKIKTGEAKLYGGKISNPKELTNLQTEVDTFKAKRSQLEDKVLETMGEIEQVEGGVVTLRGELKKLEAEWQQQRRQLTSELERVKAAIAELQSRRGLLVASIEPESIHLYDQLRKQRGTAIALVEQGICASCRISLSTARLQQVRSNIRVQCSNCGRILFLP